VSEEHPEKTKAEWLARALEQANAQYAERRAKLAKSPQNKDHAVQELYLGALHAVNTALVLFQHDYECYGKDNELVYGAILGGLAEDLSIASLAHMGDASLEARKRTLFKQQQRLVARGIKQGLLPLTLNAAEKLERSTARIFDAQGRPLRRDN
jgi:hypothetical protein